MIEMTLGQVAVATGGRLCGAEAQTFVSGAVEFDSRKVGPGGLFVALVGERVDGHDFAAEVLAGGAVAVLGTRHLDGVPMVLVDDPLAAMGALARVVVDYLTGRGGGLLDDQPDDERRDQLTVIGLTGSSGKTTTKDLLAQVLAKIGPTVAAAGSFNNELGHPYTALQASEDTRFLVLEMGARGPGHIAHLCQVAPPHIGVVLNAGVAHLGEFGSVAAIAAAKGELVAALPADGLAVLNSDDPQVAAMAARGSSRVVGYGEHAYDAGMLDADDRSLLATVRAVDVSLDAAGRAAYTLQTPEGTARVQLPLVGAHQVGNTLAVAAVAREIGLGPGEVAAALGQLRTVSPRRMDVFTRPDGVTVIDDSYNANPASVAVALRALVALARQDEPTPRRTLAVLGYLAELGDHEQEGHEQVGQMAAEFGVDLVVVVGESAAPIHHAAAAHRCWPGASVLVADQQQAVALLDERLHTGDVVLVKGSRYQTWDVADWLRISPKQDRVQARAAEGGT